jgi:hypothetical protein
MVANRPDSDAFTQQQLLRLTMRKLKLTREQFCTHMCISISMLDRWLLPEDDANASSMPECGKAHLREVLNRQRYRVELDMRDSSGSCQLSVSLNSDSK